MVEGILVPYVDEQCKKLNNPKQAALLIFDIFRGQITEDVTNLLKKYNIHLVLVPSNMTHIFQPLDLTVNNHCKNFMKNLFTEWYSKQIEKELSLNKRVEDINIQFNLTTIKPLHAEWLVQFYNHITSSDGREIILNGWKASGIYDAVHMGYDALESLDPFQDISPLPEANSGDTRPITDIIHVPAPLKEGFINPRADDEFEEGEEYVREEEDEIDFSRNAFDIIIDDEAEVAEVED